MSKRPREVEKAESMPEIIHAASRAPFSDCRMLGSLPEQHEHIFSLGNLLDTSCFRSNNGTIGLVLSRQVEDALETLVSLPGKSSGEAEASAAGDALRERALRYVYVPGSVTLNTCHNSRLTRVGLLPCTIILTVSCDKHTLRKSIVGFEIWDTPYPNYNHVPS